MTAIKSAGFTLIELLIVVAIIGLLAVAFVPDLLSGRTTAYIAADQANLRQHSTWIELYKNKRKRFPTEGGHKFILSLWTTPGRIPHTEESFDRFWTPGLAS